MKIKELIYQTPEITEEKLLEIIKTDLSLLKKDFIKRVNQIHCSSDYSEDTNKYLLEEYDLIQDKQSRLTKSQRDLIIGFVGACMIKMVKGNGGESTSSDRLESIPEIEEVRDNPE